MKKTRKNMNLNKEWVIYYLVYYDYFSTGMNKSVKTNNSFIKYSGICWANQTRENTGI